ncbi:MAG: molybdopterin-dependent oxidoreductase [Deltaproteobacteria bacterium]|nr:molybdopterin-dependent oxidoreductase [Deltaproteobacteria bacterium]
MPENTMTIDGRNLAFEPGETILDVARKNGMFIPTLCFLKGASPTGACRVCVVEVEGGRALSPACATPAANKMVVYTNTPAVREARRTILALLLKSGNHNCAIGGKETSSWTEFEERVEDYDQSAELCPAHSACKLQAYAYKYQVDTTGFDRVETEYPIETASPLIVRDFSRCISCGRCVDACNVIQVNNAISHGYRGAEAKIVAMGDDNLERSDCVFCGQCIQACPVAALTEKRSRYQIRPWETRHVRTTCHYCSVGCQLDLHIKDDRIMKVSGVEDALPNLGRLCVRGRFGFDFTRSPDRLTQPMIRKNGTLEEVPWDEALDWVAGKIEETKGSYGPGAVAGVCSANATNESLYLMQKLFRAGIGSNNLNCPSARNGLNNPIGDFERAGRMLLIGSDVTEENPVAGTFIKRAAKNGCRLIVVDSRETKIGEFATTRLIVKEGTESVLVNGLINELVGRGREAPDPVKEAAASFSRSQVAGTTEVSAEDIQAVADILDAEAPAMLVYGSRVAHLAPLFLQLQEILGNMGRPEGGINCLGELSNSQGACDMGVLPTNLPGYVAIGEEGKAAFEKAWDCPIDGEPGPSFDEMVRGAGAAEDGADSKTRLLYCVGENLALAEPAFPGIAKWLESLDVIVVQDVLDSEMLRYADAVLPSAAWSEEDGTTTNCERRVSRVRRAVPSPGEAKPDTWIFTELAKRLGQNWPELTAREIWEKEIAALVPALRGITYDRLDVGGLQWPVPDGNSLGTPVLNGDRPRLWPGATAPFTYHHRTLLEHCDGLLESLPRSGGIGTRVPPNNLEEVTENFIKLLEEEERLDAKAEIDDILETYRPKKGGLIPVLQKVQGILGFLPASVQNYIALGLGISPADVFGVVTFYSFFTMVPRGKHVVRVCLGTACFVKGAGKMLEKLEQHLRIGVGETTEDREFSLDIVRCLGACGLAPVMVVDEVTHGMLDASEVVDIVESYREAAEAEEG